MLTISRVWRHEREPGKIHYMLEGDGVNRHLWAHPDSPLGQVLSGQLGGKRTEINPAVDAPVSGG